MNLGSLIIYDSRGKIWYNSGDISGATNEHVFPNGLPYIVTAFGELDNKIPLSVNVSVTPHKIITQNIEIKPTYEELENQLLISEGVL